MLQLKENTTRTKGKHADVDKSIILYRSECMEIINFYV